MNICGIVCEYNPFHNGHLFHIEETRRQGADAIVCIMSGNFVQRADFAIMQKNARAKAAVLSGADLVIELPLPWSIASAERFAFGAVSILGSLGVVSSISFGAENNNISRLSQIADIFLSSDFENEVLKEYESGISYAAAREKALSKIIGDDANLISTPNNILAIEYLKAIKKQRLIISPSAITRAGVSHDSCSPSDNLASASFIRNLIRDGQNFSSFLPRAVIDVFKDEIQSGFAPVFISDAEKTILARLKTMNAEDFRKLSDVSEGLEYRLVDAVAKSATLSEAIESAKTKRYAHSRIRRIFLNAFLGVTSDLLNTTPPYARILAFNDTGRAIIKQAKRKSSIPIITKAALIKEESENAQRLLTLERNADDIYSLFMKQPYTQGSTFTSSPVYIGK